MGLWHSPLKTFIYSFVQDDSGGNVNILGGDTIRHCGGKKVYLNMCLTLNGYRDIDLFGSTNTTAM